MKKLSAQLVEEALRDDREFEADRERMRLAINRDVAERQRFNYQEVFKRSLDRAPSAPAAAPRLVWIGTARALGELIYRLYEEGQIRAKSKSAALELACKLFENEKGEPLNAEAIRISLYNKKNYEGK